MRMFDDTIASIRRPGELSVWQRLALIATRVPCQRQVLVSHAIWPVPYRSFNTRPEPSNEDPRHLHAPVGYRFRSVTIFRSFCPRL